MTYLQKQIQAAVEDLMLNEMDGELPFSALGHNGQATAVSLVCERVALDFAELVACMAIRNTSGMIWYVPPTGAEMDKHITAALAAVNNERDIDE